MNFIRGDLAYNPFNDELRGLLDRLQRDPALASRGGGDSYSVREPLGILRLSKDALTMNLFMIVSAFEEPNDATLSDLRIETFFPSDEETRGLLNEFDTDLRDARDGARGD